MNEEQKEALKILKGLEFEEYDWYVKTDSFEGHAGEVVEKVEKAIKTILNLIEKQQKEIEKLKDELKEERNFNKSALETLKECVHKDKIKEKIEEYKKKCNDCNFQNTGVCKEFKAYYNCSIQSVLEVLKELLGE